MPSLYHSNSANLCSHFGFLFSYPNGGQHTLRYHLVRGVCPSPPLTNLIPLSCSHIGQCLHFLHLKRETRPIAHVPLHCCVIECFKISIPSNILHRAQCSPLPSFLPIRHQPPPKPDLDASAQSLREGQCHTHSKWRIRSVPLALPAD